MSTNPITNVIEQVQSWPATMRIELARQILASVEREPPARDMAATPSLPRGPSAAEVAAMFRTSKPTPDDKAIKQWITEHRAKKYGA